MKRLLLILLIFVSHSSDCIAQVMCRDLLVEQTSSSRSTKEMIEGFEKGLARLKEEVPKATKEDFKLFNSSQSSIKALGFLTRSINPSGEILWSLLLKKMFVERSNETPENILAAKELYNPFFNILRGRGDWSDLLRKARHAKHARAAKVELIVQLKVIGLIFGEITGRKMNLLRETDLLEILEVPVKKDLTSLALEVVDYFHSFRNRNAKILGGEEGTVRKTLHEVADELAAYHFNGARRVPLAPQDVGAIARAGTYQEVYRLLKLLKLPEPVEKEYLADLKLFENLGKTGSARAKSVGNGVRMLLLLKAAELVFGPRPVVKNHFRAPQPVFDPNAYFALKAKIEGTEYVRAIIEERMSDYLDRSDAFNSRVSELVEAVERVEGREPKVAPETAKIREELRELEVKDFDRNLDRREGKLLELEVQLDLIREKIARQKRLEGIDEFYDLNNRWQRLLPEKSYHLEGIDYSRVSFSKEVIEYFADQPLVGSRYLAALSKSYVGIKKESGLRRIPSIHQQMRDIKIIRSHGKVRIVGKLVGDQIYFFHIYASEKPYNNKNIGNIVEHFAP